MSAQRDAADGTGTHRGQIEPFWELVLLVVLAGVAIVALGVVL
jgi:hypothetical protein